MSHPQDIHPFAQVDNEEYNMLIGELNRQVVEHQPEDLLQFCTTFFLKKLEDERAESRQYDQHPLGKFWHMCCKQEKLNALLQLQINTIKAWDPISILLLTKICMTMKNETQYPMICHLYPYHLPVEAAVPL